MHVSQLEHLSFGDVFFVASLFLFFCIYFAFVFFQTWWLPSTTQVTPVLPNVFRRQNLLTFKNCLWSATKLFCLTKWARNFYTPKSFFLKDIINLLCAFCTPCPSHSCGKSDKTKPPTICSLVNLWGFQRFKVLKSELSILVEN